jgi:hypothetical protein
MEQVIQLHQSIVKKANSIFSKRQWQNLRNGLIFGGLYVFFSYLAYSLVMGNNLSSINDYPVFKIDHRTVAIEPEKPDEATRIPGQNIEVVYSDANLVFSELHPYYDEGRLTILGSLENSNDFPLENANVHVSLYDQAGQKLYECSNESGMLDAFGGSSSVSVRCGCSKNPVPGFSSMQLAVY